MHFSLILKCFLFFSLSLTALPEQKEKAQELIKNLKFTFSPDKFENPDIQEHWRNIEALALERTEREEFVDYASRLYTYHSSVVEICDRNQFSALMK